MLNKILKWFGYSIYEHDKIERINNEIFTLQKNVYNRIEYLEKFLQQNLVTNADIHLKSNTNVVIIGTLNGKDYVNIFDIDNKHLPEIVSILKQIKRVSTIGKIDWSNNIVKSMINDEW